MIRFLNAFTDLRWISEQLGVSPPGVEVCSVGLDVLAAVGNAMGVEDKLAARDSKEVTLTQFYE